MKLYSQITSERNSRPAKKGGDKWLENDLYVGNKLVRRYILDDNGDEVTLTEYDGQGKHVCTTHL